MKKLAQALIISAAFLTISTAAQAQVSFDIHFGHPPPVPRAYYVPPQPGPDFVWVEGYWYPQGSHYVWHNGYWTRAPYADAYWVAPYYSGRTYYAGHWEGHRGDVYHDHHWDHDHARDEHHEPNGRGHGHGDDDRR
jgi:hypothetical protein